MAGADSQADTAAGATAAPREVAPRVALSAASAAGTAANAEAAAGSVGAAAAVAPAPDWAALEEQVVREEGMGRRRPRERKSTKIREGYCCQSR